MVNPLARPGRNVRCGVWLAAVFGLAVHAADLPLTFTDAPRQARYEQLLNELRCLVCQNQSLADSHADLAQDLRNEVFRMIGAGQTNAEIIVYLVKRYGDFVLYKPPMKDTTWLLWFGPLLMLLTVGGVWWRVARKSIAHPSATTLSAEEEAQLKETLNKSILGFSEQGKQKV